MSRRQIVVITFALLFVLTEITLAQAPATQPARGRGRGRGRGPTTNPNMLQDPQTGQWYTPMQHFDYAFGADLSFVKQLEDRGRQFKDTDGQVKPALQIFANHGYNWIRLRICVPPLSNNLPNDLPYTIAMATEAKKLGMKFFLDFHCSNGWADPTNEPTPVTWRELDVEQMSTALFEHTRDTIRGLREANVMPDMVQVGNEIGNGFLWPTADIRQGQNWDNFARLLLAGINGVEAGAEPIKMPLIMIHVDHGGNIALTRAYFEKINSYKVPHDTIGVSFYPWSHGTLMDLKANLDFISTTYNKDVYLVETGYYHTPSQYFRQTPGPLPETPEGQAQWLDEVHRIVMNTVGGKGKGVMWWEPAASGGLVNRGYFDQEGNPQPIFNVFHKWTRPVHRTDNQ